MRTSMSKILSHRSGIRFIIIYVGFEKLTGGRRGKKKPRLKDWASRGPILRAEGQRGRETIK